MDKMYEFFYMAALVSGMLLSSMTLVSALIGKRPPKILRCIFIGLFVIIVVAMISFVVTLTLER